MNTGKWISPAHKGLLLAFDDSAATMRLAERECGKRSRRATLRLCLCAGILFCLAALAQGAYAQTAGLPNFDDTTTGWLLCSGACAGGHTPTQIIQRFNIPTPSLDGKSMELSISGNAGTNNGWYHDSGPQDNLTTFTLDMYFNIPSKTYIQALEFDQYQYLLAGHGGVTSNTRLYFGTECVTGSTWQIWDSSGIGWVNTGAACNYTASSTAFNHLVIHVHRVTGDTSCAGGRPCMYYDSITMNGTTAVSNRKTNSGALPAGWGEQTGLMIQLDTNSACGSACTITEYVDKGNFTIN